MNRTTEILPEHPEVPRSIAAERRHATSPNTTLAAVTDVGRVRDQNEDAVYVRKDGRLLIVADGMGGHAAGEVASRLAVEALIEFMTEDWIRRLEEAPEKIPESLKAAMMHANNRVLEESRMREDRRGMGTTIIFAVLLHERVFMCHVGDVRGYVRTPSGLQQLTRDHSVVGDLVHTGNLTPEEARQHPRRNLVLQALGLPMHIVPEVNEKPLSNGDLVLLCSDGLVEDLSDLEIAEILSSDGPASTLATELVDKTIEAGGRDNISVALYQFRPMQGKWTSPT